MSDGRIGHKATCCYHLLPQALSLGGGSTTFAANSGGSGAATERYARQSCGITGTTSGSAEVVSVQQGQEVTTALAQKPSTNS